MRAKTLFNAQLYPLVSRRFLHPFGFGRSLLSWLFGQKPMGLFAKKPVANRFKFGGAFDLNALLLIFILIPLPLSAEPRLLITANLNGWTSQRWAQPEEVPFGLAHLEPLLDHLGPGALKLDGGEALSGSPEAAFCKRQGCPSLMDRLKGYDALVPGGGDLDWGWERLAASGLPYLAANLKINGQRPFGSYKIFELEGVKIAVLGLANPALPLGHRPIAGLEIEDPVSSAQAWIKRIQNDHPNKLVILYSGLMNPTDGAEEAKLARLTPPGQGRRLARLAGVDLVIAGGERRLPRPGLAPYEGGAVLISAGSRGRALVEVSLGPLPHINLHRAQGAEPRPPKGLLPFLTEPLPYKLKGKPRVKLAICLDQVLALAAQKPGESSAFGKIYLENLGLTKGRLLTRADLYRWLPHDELAVTIRLSQRELALLAHPAAPYGKKKPNRARQLHIALAQPLDLSLEARSSLKREYLVQLSDYHLNGGGGVVPMLFLDPKELIQAQGLGAEGAVPANPILKQGLRELIFSYLKSPNPLPSSCRMLKRTADSKDLKSKPSS